jgi:hypothetical protein
MVEEVRRRIADRGWILIEDRSSGAALVVLTIPCAAGCSNTSSNAAPQRFSHRSRPAGRPFHGRIAVGGIQSQSHGRQLRDLRVQEGNGGVPPAEFASSCRRLASVIPVSRWPSLSPPARKKSVVCGSNVISPDFTRGRSRAPLFIIP